MNALPSSNLMFVVSLACVALMTSHADGQTVIVYGNGSYRNADTYKEQVVPQSRQEYSPSQDSSRNGYSLVTPRSRVQAYNRVSPPTYRGVRQRSPSLRYTTQQDGFFYGTTPANGYGLFYGNQTNGSAVGPQSLRPGSRKRIFPGQ